jgi:hypothetical protein
MRQSSEGRSSRACKAGSCQPPCQLACSSALPLADALFNVGGHAREFLQPAQGLRHVAAAQAQVAFAAGLAQLALQLCVQAGGFERELSFAAFARGLRFELAAEFGVVGAHAQGRQHQGAAGLFGVPAAGGAGIAQAQLAQGIVFGAGGIVRAACTFASKAMAAPWLRTSALPSSGSGASWLCRRAGLTCAAAWPAASRRGVRAWWMWRGRIGPFAAGQQLAAAQLALSVRTMAAPPRHSPWVSSRSSGQLVLVPGAGQGVGQLQLQQPGGELRPAVVAPAARWRCLSAMFAALRARRRRRPGRGNSRRLAAAVVRPRA